MREKEEGETSGRDVKSKRRKRIWIIRLNITNIT